MTVITRFAPSPTGKLHVGNVRAALISWLYARKNGGQYILRIDDTDKERSRDEYTESIKHDLKWLGLDWDRYEHQSPRMDKYKAALDKLKADGRLYPCYETPEELGLKRKSQLSRGLPPIYDRGALKLTDEQKTKYEAEGRLPHWRFKLNHDPIVWNDLVRGEVSFHGKDLSDPVLVREDGTPLYHICSVVDDIEYGVNTIVRGEDHVSNTASHIQMIEALGGTVPTYAHNALLAGEDGGKLSKRIGSLGIETMRDEMGIDPRAIVSVMARLGSSDPVEAFGNIDDIVAQFDITKFSRAAAKFSMDEIKRINVKLVHMKTFDEVKARLEEIGLGHIDEDFWLTARPNIERISDMKEWDRVANGPVEPVIADEDKEFLEQAAALLPEGPFNKETWGVWLKALKENTDRKGKGLFMPLRKALTGMEHGPELGDLLSLIGHDRAKSRLLGEEL